MLNQEARDLLQELLNMAFGTAAGELGDVADIYVDLKIPRIDVVDVDGFPQYACDVTGTAATSSIVSERFWGDFDGAGLLFFPFGSGKELMTAFSHHPAGEYPEEVFSTLERGVLLEVGNILLGACIGKLAEILETYVTYAPPQVFSSDDDEWQLLLDDFDTGDSAIVMKTNFTFHSQKINGCLIIVTSRDAVEWLKAAMDRFLEAYR